MTAPEPSSGPLGLPSLPTAPQKPPEEPFDPGERPFEQEISVRDLLLKIWRGKWIVIAVSVVIVALVVTWMKITSPLYSASMVIAPAQGASDGGLSGALSRFGGLASLAGVDLPTDNAVSPFTEFTELITSSTLAQRLQERHGALQKVFEDSWDPEAGAWLPPAGPVAAIKGWIYDFFGMPAWSEPSAISLAEFLEEEIKIAEVQETGMMSVWFRHEDPQFALQLLRWIHEEGDAQIREHAKERTSRQIAYVEEKLRTVTTIEHRQLLVELLSSQEQRMMMIEVDLPYAARIIEAPRVTDQPIFPKPPLFLAVGIVSGFLIGVFVVFLVDALRRP